ncbi:MAG: SDR family NAD(P)-dependent oxidoreductase [Bacteroidales bacterium]|nr:SDR family NAD(P)-dependent oxidoreductase [Bacteroidales bacterium]
MTILITGATSGIGEGCARKYAAEGHTLVLNGRNAEKLETLRTALVAEYNVPITTLCFDVRDRQAAREALASLPEEFAAIDVLVNNAGLVPSTLKPPTHRPQASAPWASTSSTKESKRTALSS